MGAAAVAAVALAPTANATPIGGGAETGCWGEGLDVCDVKFRVTKIVQGVTCNDPSLKPPGPDEQWLRFDLDVMAKPQFYSPDSPWAFYIKLWNVEDTVHGVIKTRLAMSSVCSDSTVRRPNGKWSVPLESELRPGDHVKASVVIIAPKPANYLTLNNGDSQWKWDIKAFVT
jgi:hypothetical protein